MRLLHGTLTDILFLFLWKLPTIVFYLLIQHKFESDKPFETDHTYLTFFLFPRLQYPLHLHCTATRLSSLRYIFVSANQQRDPNTTRGKYNYSNRNHENDLLDVYRFESCFNVSYNDRRARCTSVGLCISVAVVAEATEEGLRVGNEVRSSVHCFEEKEAGVEGERERARRATNRKGYRETVVFSSSNQPVSWEVFLKFPAPMDRDATPRRSATWLCRVKILSVKGAPSFGDCGGSDELSANSRHEISVGTEPRHALRLCSNLSCNCNALPITSSSFTSFFFLSVDSKCSRY